MTGAIPKIVWTLWLQGWRDAPRIAQASLKSWKNQNPEWSVHALDRTSLANFLPESELSYLAPEQHSAAQSDQIRIALLHRYGGFWADATTVCATPLDEWLPASAHTGFFAFSKPTEDRLLASWFLAAERGNYIVERWREATSHFWSDPHHRQNLDDYFWFHHLFGDLCQRDDEFRRAWKRVPTVSAQHPGHFGPNDTRLLRQVDRDQLNITQAPPAPVLKLTHKLPDAEPSNRLIDAICDWSEALPQQMPPKSQRLLVCWYGSFAGHGTVGDLRSLETLASHLVGCGHVVSHATADQIEIVGARRVDWQQVASTDLDAVLFVCGPILSFHPQTNSLFDRFKHNRMAGVGVSLMPKTDPGFSNPFEIVFAREGGERRYGDLAIIAPLGTHRSANSSLKVGVSLRGLQHEYGAHRCRWEETARLAHEAAHAAIAEGGEIVVLENHLTRSGLGADEIERRYAECDLVITSRFHGAITALRHGVPYIAIDQISGGAKIISLLSALPWPHAYEIDSIDAETLKGAAIELSQRPDRELLFSTRDKAVKGANETLAAVDRWIASLSLAPHHQNFRGY